MTGPHAMMYASPIGTQAQQQQLQQPQHLLLSPNTYTQQPASQQPGMVPSVAASLAAAVAAASGHASAQQQQQQQQQQTNDAMRTLYFGNLPADVTMEELLNCIKGGAIEHVKILDDRNCAFITFLEASVASTVFQESQSRRLTVQGQDVKVGWGKPSTPLPTVLQAVQQGASRNVFLGNLDDQTMTESFLTETFAAFGPIDHIKVLTEKRIAFVHLASIQAAIKAVTHLSGEPSWANRRIYYGKDRCAHVGRHAQSASNSGRGMSGAYAFANQHPHGVSHNVLGGAILTAGGGAGGTHGGNGGPNSNSNSNTGASSSGLIMAQTAVSSPSMALSTSSSSSALAALPGFGGLAGLSAGFAGLSIDPYASRGFASTLLANGSNDSLDSMATVANRTVYIGGIHPDVTTKDLCDSIRGGILQNIKYMPDRNIAFATFVDPEAAMSFYTRSMQEGLTLKSKRVKFGWGKPSPLPPSIANAVQGGASRNVYIGALDDTFNEDRLRRDFSQFGDIELINIVPDKNIGFVNFTDITFAIKAVEFMKSHPDYARHKINFGKDRCGNPPRSRSTSSGSSATVSLQSPSATAMATPPSASLPSSSSSSSSLLAGVASQTGSSLSNLSPPSSPNAILFYKHRTTSAGSSASSSTSPSSAAAMVAAAAAAGMMPSPTGSNPPALLGSPLAHGSSALALGASGGAGIKSSSTTTTTANVQTGVYASFNGSSSGSSSNNGPVHPLAKYQQHQGYGPLTGASGMSTSTLSATSSYSMGAGYHVRPEFEYLSQTHHTVVHQHHQHHHQSHHLHQQPQHQIQQQHQVQQYQQPQHQHQSYHHHHPHHTHASPYM
ncbi:hypothetical protein BC831DRAFT_509068 [Entophlyctis helioformis]|nr:hypothetical protein BC831DRAFT_509068 [Entophlyctis helioformis]